MAININHTNNTLSSNSGTFIFGTGIVPSIENAVYSSNFSGKYYGDGSALTGLATGDFLLTGQTGIFITNPNDFRTPSTNFSFVFGSNSNSGQYNLIQGSNNVISGDNALIFGENNTLFDNANSNVVLSSSATLSGYACNNVIVGGILHKVCANTFSSVILGGIGIVASSSSTAYANNFCAYDGKFYGDGSALTGLATGLFITTGQTGAFGGGNVDLSSYVTTGQTGNFISLSKCQVVAKNTTPFDICAVTRVASTYIGNQRITDAEGTGIFYVCDHNDNSADDCNLYTISNGYCAAQFSAMILGNAEYAGGTVFTTSMKIDGFVTCDGVVNQSKVIHGKAFPTEDACVVLEGQSLKIYITGAQTGMNWGTRVDILGMQGYD